MGRVPEWAAYGFSYERWLRKRVMDLHHKNLERLKAITSPYRMPWHRDVLGQNVARPKWLWNCHSAKVFEWALEDKLPEYTIISYTWAGGLVMMLG